jgi:hypothetical protein
MDDHPTRDIDRLDRPHPNFLKYYLQASILAELEVHTASGGGKAPEDDKSATRNLHVGHFRGLEDAWALRDRLRGALARHRASGLGDPDDDRSPPPDGRAAAPGPPTGRGNSARKRLGDFARRSATTSDGRTGVCARTRPAERTEWKRG